MYALENFKHIYVGPLPNSGNGNVTELDVMQKCVRAPFVSYMVFYLFWWEITSNDHSCPNNVTGNEQTSFLVSIKNCANKIGVCDN